MRRNFLPYKFIEIIAINDRQKARFRWIGPFMIWTFKLTLPKMQLTLDFYVSLKNT